MPLLLEHRSTHTNSHQHLALMKSSHQHPALNSNHQHPAPYICPICFQLFCFEEIEAHASNFSGWLLESDQPQDLREDDVDDGNVKIMMTDEIGFVDRKKLLQEEVNKLVASTDELEQTRVTVRRKCL